MNCPINESCKHTDETVTVLMCNECMANKINSAKGRIRELVSRSSDIIRKRAELAWSSARGDVTLYSGNYWDEKHSYN